MTTGTYSFVYLIAKIILSVLASTLSLPISEKIKWFDHLSFSLVLKLINDIYSDLQKLLRYFNDAAIAVFFNIPFPPSTSVYLNNSALCLSDLKASMFAITASKLVASTLK